MPQSFNDLVAEILGRPFGSFDFGSSGDRGAFAGGAQAAGAQITDRLGRGQAVDDGTLAGLLATGGLAASPGSGRGAARIDLNNSLIATLTKAFGLDKIANQRFDEAKTFLTSEFNKFNEGFDARGSKADRLKFAGAADRFGREAASGLSNLRTSLGARGINPNSGSAAALAGNIGLRQQAQLTGAKRDITIENLRRRDAHNMDRFRNAFGIGQFFNQGASEIGLAALGSLTSARFQQTGQQEAQKEQSKARKDAQFGQLLGGVGSFAGAFL